MCGVGKPAFKHRDGSLTRSRNPLHLAQTSFPLLIPSFSLRGAGSNNNSDSCVRRTTAHTRRSASTSQPPFPVRRKTHTHQRTLHGFLKGRESFFSSARLIVCVCAVWWSSLLPLQKLNSLSPLSRWVEKKREKGNARTRHARPRLFHSSSVKARMRDKKK